MLNPKNFKPDKLAVLERYLRDRVIGQEEAIQRVINYLNVAFADMNDPKKPLAVLFFAGPTGVGKTEMSLALADYFFRRQHKQFKKSVMATESNDVALTPDAEKKSKKEDFTSCLIRVDCGRYSGSMGHGVIDLLGAPTSYLGHSKVPPILSPVSFPGDRVVVLLFDEIEKALFSEHGGDNIRGILMSILDYASIVNNMKEEVKFTRTVIIFTSNLGSREILTEASQRKLGFRQRRPLKHVSDEEIGVLNQQILTTVTKKYEEVIPPELRARIGSPIVFSFLTKKDLIRILHKEINALKITLLNGHRIDLDISKTLFTWLLDNTDSENGIRQMQALIRIEIKNGLARILNTKDNPIQLKLDAADDVVVKLMADIRNGQIIFWLP